MCNRVKPAKRALLKSTFGNILIIDEGVERSIDEIEEPADVVLAYEQPKMTVITSLAPQRFEYMSWGYVSKRMCTDKKLYDLLGGPMVHARTEGIFGKQTFQESIRQRRCIIPVEGFYDYQHRTVDGKKVTQSYHIRKNEGPVFAAGIWDECEGRKTFAILTTDTNPLLTEIANKTLRQPLIVDQEDWAQWFNAQAEDEIATLFKVYPDIDLCATEYEMPKKPKKVKEEKPPTPPAPPTLF